MSEKISPSERQPIHGQWSSRLAFILAVSGSAVGLGNIWKFPYITGVNGGGAFVLVYLICILAIGFPIMISEIMLGRRGRRNPITSMELLGHEETGSGVWKFVGVIGLVAGFLILSFYSVIAGWTLNYFILSLKGTFTGLLVQDVNQVFDNLNKSFFNTVDFSYNFHGSDNSDNCKRNSTRVGTSSNNLDACSFFYFGHTVILRYKSG